MHTTTLKLVTIISDRLLATDVVSKICELGARGYTISDAQGQGARGLQPLDWEGANSRIEAVVSPEVAERIISHLAEKYFKHHGMIAFVHDVEVVRGDRYM
jgi:nitrogen regulatory protein PII